MIFITILIGVVIGTVLTIAVGLLIVLISDWWHKEN